MKIGDYIICLDNALGKCQDLTIGKVYKVVDFDEDDMWDGEHPDPTIIDDAGDSSTFCYYRFKVVNRELKLKRILNEI